MPGSTRSPANGGVRSRATLRGEGITGRAPGVIAFPGRAAGGERRMALTVTRLAALSYVAAAVGMYDARAHRR